MVLCRAPAGARVLLKIWREAGSLHGPNEMVTAGEGKREGRMDESRDERVRMQARTVDDPWDDEGGVSVVWKRGGVEGTRWGPDMF